MKSKSQKLTVIGHTRDRGIEKADVVVISIPVHAVLLGLAVCGLVGGRVLGQLNPRISRRLGTRPRRPEGTVVLAVLHHLAHDVVARAAGRRAGLGVASGARGRGRVVVRRLLVVAEGRIVRTAVPVVGHLSSTIFAVGKLCSHCSD